MRATRPSGRKEPMRVAAVFAVLFTLLAGAPARAHDTWILPAAFTLEPGRELRIDGTSGMTFPVLDYAVDPARIEQAALRLAGKTIPLARRKDAKSLVLTAAAPDAGLATAWLSLAPRTLELTPAQVDEYLKEIGAPPEVERRWRERSGRRRWRETYRKHAKTMLRVGDAAGDGTWKEPAGLALEIVPERDPTALAPGDALGIRLLEGGRPRAGLAVTAVAARGGPRAMATTDAAGRASFTLATAGPWLLAATELREKASETAVAWESDFTTLTLAAGASGR
jgi:uncharacterized GH25 family protein